MRVRHRSGDVDGDALVATDDGAAGGARGLDPLVRLASTTYHARGPMSCARSFSCHATCGGVISRQSSVKTRASRP